MARRRCLPDAGFEQPLETSGRQGRTPQAEFPESPARPSSDISQGGVIRNRDILQTRRRHSRMRWSLTPESWARTLARIPRADVKPVICSGRRGGVSPIMNRRARRALQFAWLFLLLFVLGCALAPGRWAARLALSGNWQHFGAFLALMVLGALAFSLSPARLAVLLLLVGMGIEWAQNWVPGRALEWRDWAMDGAGILAGWLFTLVLARARRVSSGN